MKFALAILAFLVSLSLFSQEKEQKVTLEPTIHFRTFWMSTSYPSDFKNDFALGSSLKLGGDLKLQDRVKVSLGYRFFGNLWSSDLGELDPISRQPNRYEAGLFDLLNPKKKYFGKIETLSFSYSKSNWGFVIGRMGIDSDWINLQDGRLSPTAIEGVNLWFQTPKSLKVEFWGIGKISVRGASEWLSVGESIGVFPTGRSYLGHPSQYFQNTNSDWISILELFKEWENKLIKTSITTVDNISNTIWVRGEHVFPKLSSKLLMGVQLGFQHGLGNGGNTNEQFYKNPHDRNFVFSIRVGYSNDRLKSNINFTQLGGDGQWLSPREWGKDAWYTFIPRERNEGFSNLTALTAYTEYRFHEIGLVPYVHFGLHFLPNPALAKSNKYNFPSYRQLNLGLKYSPKGLKRLTFQGIIMNKEALNKSNLSPTQLYNKVGMIHTNLILNWNLN